MLLPFDYIGYKRLSENKRFPNHHWYSDATWGENGLFVDEIGIVCTNVREIEEAMTNE